LMGEHGGRYGIHGFNVAHFSWIDALQPVPTPSTYLATIFTAGLLAFALAAAPAVRAVSIALVATCTYAWAMSQLDSYQHHYLLSWFLLYMAWFPELSAKNLTEGGQPRRGPAPAYALLLLTSAVVYFYTGVSKTDPDWRSGLALERLSAE